VLENGLLVEQGSPEELKKKEGLYYKLLTGFNGEKK
jgi:ABC-type multidrug transport system fused ATPase/permease subunit